MFLKAEAGWMTQGGQQKVKWYKKVNTDAKAAYLLALSEKIVYKISGREWFQEAREAMDRCWELESDEMIDQFTDKVNKINGYQEQWAERLQQYLLQNYPFGSNNRQETCGAGKSWRRKTGLSGCTGLSFLRWV